MACPLSPQKVIKPYILAMGRRRPWQMALVEFSVVFRIFVSVTGTLAHRY
jgi:hypothetical protein